ncbi:MAG TPA: DNA translocase FtsK [Candidatus Paceibacterota bacterium]|nr:DNA translocase FtsK [Candidatus Paceibacterota bacterium]
MAKKNGKEKRSSDQTADDEPLFGLHPDTLKSIWAVVFLGCGLVLALAYFGNAGPAGQFIYDIFSALLGDWGYVVLPLSLFLVAGVFFVSHRRKIVGLTSLGGLLLILSVLGLMHLLADPIHSGWSGYVLGALEMPFGHVAAIILNVIVLCVALLITLNVPLRWPHRTEAEEEDEDVKIAPAKTTESAPKNGAKKEEEDRPEPDVVIAEDRGRLPLFGKGKKPAAPKFPNYVPPPLELLKSSVEKPTTGDLRANANIIRRTLESFGIPVEMGEVNIGPKVTRYTLKPAEGVKLSRITALNQDLSLALAAHPIRIEAPIPGKSLVGIEVPNKAAAVVRLGSLMAYPDFQAGGPLGFVLGRDVSGEPVFANLEKMPHMLVAGATGSGKSVAVHSLIVSMLYKNSPAQLKLVMVDPKRVELSIYENIPHLISPVITENKKAAGVFRWAIAEMERRYELLQAAGSRDITSYNKNGGKDDPLPFIVIIVDELADLMTSYGREVEGSIVRLAQMARATGIHLVLTTQRPSVEVITGLIKANITGRIALQVASQIDSRTILDTSGAEKLLGGGDLLFVSAELSKPRRIQGAYISEEEINAVADFIREHNLGAAEAVSDQAVNFDAAAPKTEPQDGNIFDEFMTSDTSDEMYDEAVQVVAEAQKASASLLQRRLKVGYARAARLLDLMEEKGIIGPGDGAKPREVFLEKPAPE